MKNGHSELKLWGPKVSQQRIDSLPVDIQYLPIPSISSYSILLAMIIVNDESQEGMLFSMFPTHSQKHKDIHIPSLLITRNDGDDIMDLIDLVNSDENKALYINGSSSSSAIQGPFATLASFGMLLYPLLSSSPYIDIVIPSISYLISISSICYIILFAGANLYIYICCRYGNHCILGSTFLFVLRLVCSRSLVIYLCLYTNETSRRI